MGAVYLSQGYLSEALPLVALTLMSVSYLTKGALETADYIKSRVK